MNFKKAFGFFKFMNSDRNVWECGYLTEEVSKGFGQFYANVNGVADNFAKFWKLMANEFKDLDNVLGYELINEPFAGDIYEAFSVLLPGMAGHVNLAPLYEKTAKVQYINKNSKLLACFISNS